MNNSGIIRITTLLAVWSVCALAHAQVDAPVVEAVPSSVSFSPDLSIPVGDGLIHYDLRLSEIIAFGLEGSGTTNFETAPSYDLSYMSKSQSRPFSAFYAGGVLFTTISNQNVNVYQDLSLSQGFVGHRWTTAISDNFSYLPFASSSGFSGIPGGGDIGVPPVPGGGSGATVLTNFANQITNNIVDYTSYQINHDTFITGSAGWSIMRFLSGNGYNNNVANASLGMNRRLNARTSVGGNYSYSRMTYDFNGFVISTQGANFTLQRQFTRALDFSASAGPQWVSSSNPATYPSKLNAAVSLNLNYSRRFTSASIAYNQGAVNGYGVLPGAFQNTVVASVQRTLNRDWSISFTGSYLHTTGLGTTVAGPGTPPSYGSGNTFYGGVQGTRKLGRSCSVYLSYNGQHQSIDQTLAPVNAFSGFSQFVSGGITYSPRPIHPGH